MIASVLIGADFVRKLIKPMEPASILVEDLKGLERGGLYIGWLERTFIMLLVLTDQATGVGFLITAKSILRFGDIRESKQRALTEYVIIGTFVSFGWGLLIADLTRLGFLHWLPLLPH